MDVVRYLLATAVIIAHFNELTSSHIPYPISSYNAVGGFFALSGFLIYPSFVRHRRLGHYIARRARRILPPYLLCVIVAAIALVALSSLTPAAYFTSAGFLKYLAANCCFLNFLAPTLPGVFDTPEFVLPAVNGSLWTMKVEWLLYLSVPIMAWLISRLRKRWQPRVIPMVIVLSIAYHLFFEWLAESTGSEIYSILGRQFCGQMSYFYIGAWLYFSLASLRRHSTVIGIITLVLLIVDEVFAFHLGYIKMALDPILISVAVIWVSVIGNWGSHLARHDNVSYDMYIFHFPIIQVGVALGIGSINPYAAFAIIFAIIVIISMLSWNLVGRYFLNSRLKHLNS